MMVLADSSVWVAHFKQPNQHLESLLAEPLIRISFLAKAAAMLTCV